MKKQLLLVASLGCISVGISSQNVDVWNAAVKNDIAAIQQYIDAGGDVNMKLNGAPLLQGAAEGDAVEVTELLLKKGADIDAKNSYGQTPLHAAASGNKVKTTDFLIKKGANINAQSGRRQTPLHLAASFHKAETAKLLIEGKTLLKGL